MSNRGASSRRIPAAGVVVLAASLACGGGEEELEIPRPACPDQVNADFELRQPDSGILGATGSYWDAPAEVRFSSALDGCVTWSVYFSEDPPDPRNTLDVGVVRFTATDFELVMFPTALNEYATAGSRASFAAGEPVTVSGAGGDTGVEPFEITARAVPDLTVPATTLSAAAGEDLEVTWDQADSPPGTRVEFAAQTSNTDFIYYLSCWSDDTGAMTIPAEKLDRPLIASLERVHSAAVETEHGCGTFEIRSAVRLEIQSE